MKPLSPAQSMARILGTTVHRCEEMLYYGNQAGLSTAYMVACVRAYAAPKKRRQAVKALCAIVAKGE